MNKKTGLLLCMALLLMLLLSACFFVTQQSPTPSEAQPQAGEETPAPAEPQPQPEQPAPEQPAEVPAAAQTITAQAFAPEMIAGTQAEQMFLYHSSQIPWGDATAVAELYVDAADGGDGMLDSDDGQRWSLLLRSNDQVFLLLDKEYVQMGQVEYTLYQDYDSNGALIVVQISQGAGLTLYEFRCSATEAVKTEIYRSDGNLGLLDSSPGGFPRLP